MTSTRVCSNVTMVGVCPLAVCCSRWLTGLFPTSQHYQFCTGTMSQEESLRAAIATWPADVRPIVHWSESPPAEVHAPVPPHVARPREHVSCMSCTELA